MIEPLANCTKCGQPHVDECDADDAIAFERAAVVKYLRKVAVGQSSDTHRLLFDITYAIEQAEHHEPR